MFFSFSTRRVARASFALGGVLTVTRLVTACCVALLSGCGEDVFTLYRDSVVAKSMRVHVATFDASDGADYNRENCEQARALFQAQPNIQTRFWCEKGTYKK